MQKRVTTPRKTGSSKLSDGATKRFTPKAVTFNTETLESSIGGTETPGMIKELSTIETPERQYGSNEPMFQVSGIRSVHRSLVSRKDSPAPSSTNTPTSLRVKLSIETQHESTPEFYNKVAFETPSKSGGYY